MKFFAGCQSEPAQKPNKLTPLLRAEVELSEKEYSDARLPMRVSNVAEADVVAAPKVWGVYVAQRNLEQPIALAAEARRAGKPFLVWHTGDLNPLVPFDNCVVMVNALERSMRPHNWHVSPYFIDDPLRIHGSFEARDQARRPRVGFCGYAAANPIKLAYTVLENAWFRMSYAVQKTMYEPPPLMPATLLRAKVLDNLQRSHEIETNFIIRTRYKAGVYTA
jgi:hypothetical protein